MSIPQEEATCSNTQPQRWPQQVAGNSHPQCALCCSIHLVNSRRGFSLWAKQQCWNWMIDRHLDSADPGIWPTLILPLIQGFQDKTGLGAKTNKWLALGDKFRWEHLASWPSHKQTTTLQRITILGQGGNYSQRVHGTEALLDSQPSVPLIQPCRCQTQWHGTKTNAILLGSTWCSW